MTPAARLAAAIELVGTILERRWAADRALSDWARSNRYAGSGDRRAINESVYAVLRQKAALDWSLDEPTPRLLVLKASGLPVEQIETLCTGLGHAPAPLTGEERAALIRVPPPAPLWVQAACPEWLWPHFTARFGDDALAELVALQGRASFDLRVNTLKAKRDDVVAALDGVPTPHAPTGVRLPAPLRLEQHELFTSGAIEPQDEAAQIASLLVDAKPGMTVVDFCAGAGGKTLALAAAMRNQGELLASDVETRRLNRLRPRAERAGATIVTVGAAAKPGSADRVLLDVPCSGTGTWRRNPEARWHLRPTDLIEHGVRQAALLEEGAELVKPGGRLVYATCSLLRQEDEGAVEVFLSRHPEFTRADARQVWAEVLGEAAPLDGPDLLLTPRRHGCDGFYTAILSRTG